MIAPDPLPPASPDEHTMHHPDIRHRLSLLACSIFVLAGLVHAGDAVQPATVVSGLRSPTCMVFPTGLPTSLAYVLECGNSSTPGSIRVVQLQTNGTGTLLATPLWLPTTRTWNGTNESGMLAAVVDPDFATNRYLYVLYSVSSVKDTVTRITVDASGTSVLPGTEREILAIARDSARGYHHGGSMHFHPAANDDAQRSRKHWLYIALGNNDISAPNQDLADIRAKVLRIDVAPAQQTSTSAYQIPAANPVAAGWSTRLGSAYSGSLAREIIISGVRNPWRCSFDAAGNYWVGVVGGGREQIFRVPASTLAASQMSGLNFAYPAEGILSDPANKTQLDALRGTYMPPVFAESTSGNAFIGGYAYRGSALGQGWSGSYIFASYQGTGGLRALRRNATSGAWLQDDVSQLYAWLGTTAQNVSSLAEDNAGELYYLKYNNGTIYRLAPATVGPVAPSISGTPPTAATVGAQVQYSFTTSGSPAVSSLSIIAGNRPGMSVVASGTGWLFTWTPAPTDVGTVQVTLSASNGTAPDATQTFSMQVLAAQQPDIVLEDPSALLQNGLDCSYYDNSSGTAWTTLPAFAGLTATRSSFATMISVAPAQSDPTDYALRFAGYLRVESTGTYDVQIVGDDSARVVIGTVATTSTTGTRSLALAAGYHRLLVEHVQSSGSAVLALRWRTSGMGTLVDIPAAQFARRKSAGGIDDYQAMGPYLDGRLPSTLASSQPPGLLSQTGIFSSTAGMVLSPGIIPYDVNSPLWSDNAGKSRWMAVPRGSSIGFDANYAWTIPSGTVFIKHFELEGRRLETRLLVLNDQNNAYGVTYKWRSDQSDADLITSTQDVDVAARTVALPSGRSWVLPTRTNCMDCHTGKADTNGVRYFALGARTHQLNSTYTYGSTGRSANQLSTLASIGILSAQYSDAGLAGYPKAVAIGDTSKPLVDRLRSYLSSNCAMCHIGEAGQNCPTLDARFSNPTAITDMIERPATTDISVQLMSGARMIKPGNAAHSMLYMRMDRVVPDVGVMPPLAKGVKDEVALAAFRQYIDGLGSAPTWTAVRKVDAALTAGTRIDPKGGIPYEADTAYLTNSASTQVRTLANAPTVDGYGVPDPRLYATYRLNPQNWAFPNMPAGTYRVTLRMSDEFFTTAGQRRFAVKIEGQTVDADLDIVALTGGKSRALERVYTITLGDGTLNLDLVTGAANIPTLAGILIEEQSQAVNQAPRIDSATVAPAGLTLPSNQSVFSTTASDPEGSALSYLWTVVGGTAANVSLATANASTTVATFTAAGSYILRVTVSDPQGASATADVPMTVAPSVVLPSIRINFQPATTAVPAGYLADTGQVFGLRGEQTFGWSVDNSANARKRNVHADPVLDSLNHVARAGLATTWEIALANGNYQVRILAGDPSFTDSINTLQVEHLLVPDSDGADRYDVYDVTVQVTDGRLTISQGVGGSNAKLQAIELTLIPGTSG